MFELGLVGIVLGKNSWTLQSVIEDMVLGEIGLLIYIFNMQNFLLHFEGTWPRR